jgi:hypothetical protein
MRNENVEWLWSSSFHWFDLMRRLWMTGRIRFVVTSILNLHSNPLLLLWGSHGGTPCEHDAYSSPVDYLTIAEWNRQLSIPIAIVNANLTIIEIALANHKFNSRICIIFAFIISINETEIFCQCRWLLCHEPWNRALCDKFCSCKSWVWFTTERTLWRKGGWGSPPQFQILPVHPVWTAIEMAKNKISHFVKAFHLVIMIIVEDDPRYSMNEKNDRKPVIA